MMKKLVVFQRFGAFYKRLLLRRPILVSSISTGLLSGFSDMMSQRFVERKKDKLGNVIINCKRSAKMAFLGASFFGPHSLAYY